MGANDGILGFLQDPQYRFGLNLLAQGAPGGAPGMAGIAGALGATAAQGDADSKRALIDAQTRDTRAQAGTREGELDTQGKIQALGAQYLTNGNNDLAGFAKALAQYDPKQAMGIMAALQKAVPEFDATPREGVNPATGKKASYLVDKAGNIKWINATPLTKAELTPGGVVWDPTNTAPGTTFADPNKPFAPGADGGAPAPNLPFQAYEIAKAHAGGTKISNNVALSTEKTLGTTMAEGVAKQLDTSLGQAHTAQDTLRITGQLSDLLNSGKVMAGPATKPEMIWNQIATQMGIQGKDAAEKLSNTRLAMQNLSKLEMQGAADMKGQGAITESERSLIQRSAAGDISMTLPELKSLTAALDKTARYRIQQHNQRVQPMMDNPSMKPLQSFLQVQEPPAYAAPPVAPAAGGWTVTPAR